MTTTTTTMDFPHEKNVAKYFPKVHMNVKYSDLSEAAGQPDGLAVLGIICEHDRETRQTDDFFRVTPLSFP